MNKKFYILFPFIYFLITLSSFGAQEGGQPGAFLSYGAGARALGMGNTFVGVADDASAVYWNPAGLAVLQQREVNALYATLYEQTNYSFVGYAQPLNRQTKTDGSLEIVDRSNGTRADDKLIRNYGVLGVAVVDLESTGFQLRDEFNNPTGVGGVSGGGGYSILRQDVV